MSCQVFRTPGIDTYGCTGLIIVYNHLADGRLKLAMEIINSQDLDFYRTFIRL